LSGMTEGGAGMTVCGGRMAGAGFPTKIPCLLGGFRPLPVGAIFVGNDGRGRGNDGLGKALRRGWIPASVPSLWGGSLSGMTEGREEMTASRSRLAGGVFRKKGRRGEGNRLGNLGLAYAHLGEADQARRYWTSALQVFEALENSNAEQVRGWLAGLDDPASS